MPLVLAMHKADKATEIHKIDLLPTDLKITSIFPRPRHPAIINLLKRNFRRVQLNNASSRTKWQTHCGSTSMLTSNLLCNRVHSKSLGIHHQRAVLANQPNVVLQLTKYLQPRNLWSAAWATQLSNAKIKADKARKAQGICLKNTVSNKGQINSSSNSRIRLILTRLVYQLHSTRSQKTLYLLEANLRQNRDPVKALIDSHTNLAQHMCQSR